MENNLLSQKLENLLEEWKASGMPGRDTLMKTGQALLDWRASESIDGLWFETPVFATATLDDAWGHGLELIALYAKVMGMKVVPLGLEKSAEVIITACHDIRPDYLGLTVLRFDAEEDLCEVGWKIPAVTRLIAGGPIFKADPEIAVRANVHFTAKDVAAFIRFFLTQPSP